ncbi:MAG TPA: magnesium transporter CorA family protein [Chitinophagales bacterium]|nr:magnesium transporter CorA family protein [Chitinophagales bacterium]HRK28367.1 magnesium transporter CorA family protein [Chitinophagales bacterium]
MIKYYIKDKNRQLKELSKPVKGAWINVYPPYTHEELKQLSEELDISTDFFIDSLDIDERSRYEQEDGVRFIVVNIPIKNETDTENSYDALYLTAPIGIVEVDDYIVTISAFKNLVVDHFLLTDVKSFDTKDHSLFVLLFFERTVHYFLHFLKNMNHQRNLYEKELFNAIRNQELSKLMRLQKSLVYFVTTLRDNELMMLRMQRTDFLNIKDREEESDFFGDIMIDMNQAQEMSQIYTNILNATMEAFASIISNNMNTIMQRLTSITIVLMVPTLVASFYGMNVPLWGQDNPYAFLEILLLSIVLATIIVWFFRRKRLF